MQQKINPNLGGSTKKYKNRQMLYLVSVMPKFYPDQHIKTLLQADFSFCPKSRYFADQTRSQMKPYENEFCPFSIIKNECYQQLWWLNVVLLERFDVFI